MAAGNAESPQLRGPGAGQAGHSRQPGDRPWVPIRPLSPKHRGRLLRHLQALNPTDRYLRFGYAASDDQLQHYVDRLDFRRDAVFGIYSQALKLVAAAHLAYEPSSAAASPSSASPPSTSPASSSTATPSRAEFGVSVAEPLRGRGLGAALFDHAVRHARNRGVQTLFIHALSENAAMLHIASKAGATVERDGAESEAWLKLPPDDLGSHVGELLSDQAAELDYQFKRGSRTLSGILGAIGEVQAHIQESGGRETQ
jgi:GNAT superfamily N-acetyltransferase